MYDPRYDAENQHIKQLLEATRSGNLAVIKAALNKDSSIVDQIHKGNTLLICACREAFVDAIHLLLQRGADPNLGTRFGRTPLHLAFLYSHTYEKRNRDLAHAVQLLLAHGADPNCQGPARKPMLQQAVEMGRIDIVAELLGCGARWNGPLVSTRRQTTAAVAYHNDYQKQKIP